MIPLFTLDFTYPIVPFPHLPHGEVFRYDYLDSRTITWSKSMIEEQMQQSRSGTLGGSYGVDPTNEVRQKLQQLPIENARVLVIGSERPWLEAILLSLGAAHVVTLEYSTIESQHPQISTLTPAMFRQKFMDGTLEPFDIVATHSSLEHSGLGRYRDALNPWGDLLAVARAWCVTKPNGYLYLGIPTAMDGIEYNAHRWYGKHRWPLITANWKPLVPEDRAPAYPPGPQGKPAKLTTFSDGTEFRRLYGDTPDNGGDGFLFQRISS